MIEYRNNFIQQLFCKSIDVMKTGEWQWPMHWDDIRKVNFLNESLNYAIENEFWEQAATIRDVKEKINTESSGSISNHTEQ